jgi:hypothetical protein
MIHLQNLLDLIKIYTMHKHIKLWKKKTNSKVKEHAKYLHLNPRQILKNHLFTLILMQTDGNFRVHSHSVTYDHSAYDQLKLRPKFP